MGSIYNITLFIHSWNRWIVLILGIALIIRLISSISGTKQFTSGIRQLAVFFVISLHLQLLIGLILYFFLSPLTQVAFNDFGNAMKNSGLRFWAVEHLMLNVIGIALVQIGYTRSKKIPSDSKKLKSLLIWTSIGLFIILLAIPMGIMGVERPWFRF